MKFLCLAYGAEEDWIKLSPEEQKALLAQDEVIKRRGDFVTALQQGVTTVRAWKGSPELDDQPFARSRVPLAGFSIIDAASVDKVVALVEGTPCARAGGAIEIRALDMSHS